MSESKKLFSFEFVSLNLVSLFAFCNIAVFFSFYTYLGRIGIPVEWRGFLVGLEPMTAFALRLAVIPLLTARNAVRVMLVALCLILVIFPSYLWATTIPALIVLRILHGTAFVLLVSASMALVVHFIPKEKSGQGFGIVSLASLVPYAIMPPLAEALLSYTGNEAFLYAGGSLLVIPGIILLLRLNGRVALALKGMDTALVARPTLRELGENLRQSDVLLLLAINLLMYLVYATVFFFMKDFSLQLGSGDVGLFFTISMVTMIGIRFLGGAIFDRVNRLRVLQGFLLGLALCFGLFTRVRDFGMLYLLAAFYGLCIGVVFPQLNATLFSISPARLRGLNTNLTLFMMDAGYAFSPVFGGMLLAGGYSFGALYSLCAGLVLLGVSLVVVLEQAQKARLRQAPIGE
jgi:MFS family permease